MIVSGGWHKIDDGGEQDGAGEGGHEDSSTSNDNDESVGGSSSDGGSDGRNSKDAWGEDASIESVKIIGNLPFGVATPLLFSYLSMLAERSGPFRYTDVPTELTLCFQKEVAERMVALPGTKMRCRLSAMVQHYCIVFVLAPWILPLQCRLPAMVQH